MFRVEGLGVYGPSKWIVIGYNGITEGGRPSKMKAQREEGRRQRPQEGWLCPRAREARRVHTGGWKIRST